jgi:DNA-binding response OmpR family regulator
VLVVDDEPQIREALASVLEDAYDDIDLAASAEEGLETAAEHAPDVVILDLTLPRMSGLEACRRLREWYDGPILILSVHEGEADKIAALDMGADDYITKPFAAGELLARLRALLRRGRNEEPPLAEVRVGGLCVDIPRRTVTLDGQPVRLTPMEFDILAVLARNPGRVVTSRALIQAVWGPDAVEDTRSLRVHVMHLRQKIEPRGDFPRYILTEPGVGFRLAEAEPSTSN